MIQFAPVTDSKTWNKHLAQCTYATLWQSWEFGDAMRMAEGWTPHRTLLMEGGKPIGVLQTLTRTSSKVAKVAKLFNGPELFFEPTDYAQRMHIVEEACAYWREQEYIVYVSPPFPLQNDFHLAEYDLTLGKSYAWESIRISLNQTEQQIWDGMRKSWRRRLRKALRSDLDYTRTHAPEALGPLLTRWTRAACRHNYHWPSAHLVQCLWEAAQKSRAASILTVKLNNRTVGMTMDIAFGGVLFGFVGWSNNEGKKHNVNHFIEWLTLQAARDAGLDWYDLGGASMTRTPGLAHFKLGMGGEHYALGPGLLSYNASLANTCLVHLADLKRYFVLPLVKRVTDACLPNKDIEDDII